MSVKLFFQTHGRFPTTDEFRLIRTFRQHQPDTLVLDMETVPTSKQFQFIREARHGNAARVLELLPSIPHIDTACIALPEGMPPPPHGSAAVNTKQSPNALCAAAQGDHIEVLTLLLNNNASVDSRPSQNRTALLFASESGHFNSMNYLISRGATYFTYSDQQIESYFISYTIRQSITRRELSYVLPGDLLPGIVLDYLGLGGHRTRPIERLAPVNLHNKNSFGAKPIPEHIIAPIPTPHPCPIDLTNQPIEVFTPEEWEQVVQQKTSERQKLDREEGARREAYVESKFPQAFSKDGEDGKAPAAAPQ